MGMQKEKYSVYQFEQQCNAAAVELMGVPVIKNLHPSQFEKISNWLESDEKVELHYPDQTRKIVEEFLRLTSRVYYKAIIGISITS